MTIYKKDSGIWKEIENVYKKDSGIWKEIKNVYKKDSGIWKHVHPNSNSSHLVDLNGYTAEETLLITINYYDIINGATTGFWLHDLECQAALSSSDLTYVDFVLPTGILKSELPSSIVTTPPYSTDYPYDNPSIPRYSLINNEYETGRTWPTYTFMLKSNNDNNYFNCDYSKTVGNVTTEFHTIDLDSTNDFWESYITKDRSVESIRNWSKYLEINNDIYTSGISMWNDTRIQYTHVGQLIKMIGEVIKYHKKPNVIVVYYPSISDFLTVYFPLVTIPDDGVLTEWIGYGVPYANFLTTKGSNNNNIYTLSNLIGAYPYSTLYDYVYATSLDIPEFGSDCNNLNFSVYTRSYGAGYRFDDAFNGWNNVYIDNLGMNFLTESSVSGLWNFNKPNTHYFPLCGIKDLDNALYKYDNYTEYPDYNLTNFFHRHWMTPFKETDVFFEGYISYQKYHDILTTISSFKY